MSFGWLHSFFNAVIVDKTYGNTHTQKHTYAEADTCTKARTYTYTHTRKNTHTQPHIHTHMHTHAHIYIIIICVNVCEPFVVYPGETLFEPRQETTKYVGSAYSACQARQQYSIGVTILVALPVPLHMRSTSFEPQIVLYSVC